MELIILLNPLEPSGHYMYHTVVTICTTGLTQKILHSAHSVFFVSYVLWWWIVTQIQDFWNVMLCCCNKHKWCAAAQTQVMLCCSTNTSNVLLQQTQEMCCITNTSDVVLLHKHKWWCAAAQTQVMRCSTNTSDVVLLHKHKQFQTLHKIKKKIISQDLSVFIFRAKHSIWSAWHEYESITILWIVGNCLCLCSSTASCTKSLESSEGPLWESQIWQRVLHIRYDLKHIHYVERVQLAKTVQLSVLA